MRVTLLLKEETAEHCPGFIGLEVIYKEVTALAGTELLGHQVPSAAISFAD